MSEDAALLQVTRTSCGGRLELVLSGELDNDTLPRAQDEVSAAEAEAPAVLVLDLAALEYVDSCGVRLVLLAQGAADDENRRLAVRLGHGQTRRMFDMLGITDRLEVLDREEPSS
ncbi:STAS domain-containing protein [Actinomycetospora chibensis]|uniref:STAS domain-containing protein n=1 Tax=Actinomycetospora chibensis TaxID=663606 RepID=A0ABV9RJW0_9PSEU|nr:STAS domain-containing protein [Actinomycetospora chibensis]MDD7923827.1 STAS domain-containing protein [Actinomycetospora chibensis]